MMRLADRINAVKDTVVEHRRWLHAHPELSGQEKGTAVYIAAALRKMGLEPEENVGGYGVVALIQGVIPTMNAPEEFALVRDTAQTLLGCDRVIIPDKSAMTGEDFSFFGKEVPGAFYWLGCKNPTCPSIRCIITVSRRMRRRCPLVWKL